MLAVFSLVIGAAGAIELPTPPPAAKPVAGAFKPFDLTYMPRATASVLAVRPNELLKQLGDQEKIAGDLVRRLLAAMFAFLDGDLKAANPPALADIEQVILSAQFNLGIETQADGRSTTGMGGISSGLVRTAKPFDWAACVKKWFPKVESVKHAGREYLRVPIEVGGKTSYVALFVADDRTFAFDSTEDEIRGLLTRLDKKVKPTVPVGWDEVSRDLIAFCHDTTTEGWLTAPEKPKREIDQALVTVARKSTGLAFGFSAGEKTSVRVIATARDEKAAQDVRAALKFMVADLTNEDEVPPAVAKLFARATVSRDGTVVRVRGEVSGNLLRKLLDPDAER
ncbi:MAG: hypothetical protein L0241_21560 [Planctomycetia bacterium]|nr:hypothetical protein [Planctomycetia bacterium]